MSCAVLLMGCAAQGDLELIRGTMPGGEKYTMGVHPQSVPDWLLDPAQLKLNWIVEGGVSDLQLAAIAESERSCRIYTKEVRPSRLVAVFINGVLYAAAGFLGVGTGSQVFSGAKFAQYGGYGAGSDGVAGMANGIVTLGGATYTFENCGKEIFDLFPNYKIKILQKSPY